MNISDIILLNRWLDENEKKTELINKFSKLNALLSHNKSPSRNINGRIVSNELKPFKNEKDDLINAISEINTNTLNKSQIEILRINGVADELGDLAAKKITNSFIENSADIAYLYKEMTEKENKIKEAFETIEKQSISISDYFEETLKKNHNMQVTFKNRTSITNFRELQEESKQWNKITHCISSSTASDEAIEIVSIENGSIIIELAAALPVLALTARIISEAAKIIKISIVEYKDICKLIGLDPNDEEFKAHAESLRKTVNEVTKKKSEKAVSESVENIKKDLSSLIKEGPETENHIAYAIKGVVRHLAKGGDASVSLDERQIEEMEEMGVNVPAIKESMEIDKIPYINDEQMTLIEEKYFGDSSSPDGN